MDPVGVALILFVSALFSGGLAAYAWRHRSTPGTGIVFCLMLGTTIAVFAYGMELLSSTLANKLAWVRIRYVGTALIYPMYLLLALWHTNRQKWLSALRIALLFVLPVFSVIGMLTNSLHHLHYTRIGLNTSGPFPMLAKTFGPLYGFYVITSLGYVLIALAILGLSYYATSNLFRRQTAALIIGTAVPMAAALLYFAGLRPLGGLNLLPFAYTISSLTAAWIIMGQRFFNLRPVARGMVFDSMTDGFVVLNKQLQVVEANPSALRLLGLSPDCAGRFGNRAFVNHPSLIRLIHSAPHAHVQIDQDGRIFDAFRTSLFDQQRNLAGHLISLRDITSIKQAQEELRKSENQYRFLTENMNDILWMMDMNLKTVYVTPSIEAVLGFTPEERLRQVVEEQLTPPSLRIAMETLAREKVFEKQGGDPKRKATLTLEFYHRDGSTRWLETIISG
ncbi:MAG TPA: histidine kinase N-terminal 7TM domain-containing protein, partial [Smithellaceae bacterium]|nr:histidine kinase N-terminal 7TM domain-containing protein [Smithellaceae bacterium]